MELDQEWKRQVVPIHFRLGDRTLFSKNLTLFVLNGFLSNEDQDMLVPGYESVQASFSSDGYLIRSEKIKAKPKKFERGRGWIRFVPRTYHRYYVDLSGSFENYANKFSKKSLATLKRKVRRFKDHFGGEIKWQVFRGPLEIEKFYELARMVSKKTYQEQLLDVGLPDGQHFKNKMLQLAEQDQVRGFLLFDQNVPVSYLYCPIRAGHVVYEYLGYDPQYFKWSPGTVLQLLALENIFSEKTFLTFDFTEGENDHKKFFSTGSFLCADFYFFAPKFWPLFVVLSYSGFNSFVEYAGFLVEKLNLKKVFRKILRKTN